MNGHKKPWTHVCPSAHRGGDARASAQIPARDFRIAFFENCASARPLRPALSVDADSLRDPGLLQRKSRHQDAKLLPAHPALLNGNLSYKLPSQSEKSPRVSILTFRDLGVGCWFRRCGATYLLLSNIWSHLDRASVRLFSPCSGAPSIEGCSWLRRRTNYRLERAGLRRAAPA